MTRKTVLRLFGRFLFSAIMMAALFGGPLVLLVLLSRRFTM
ncbi:Hypothetical protein RG1141_PA10520 (plasmid) [Neorhizobium galegae bv. officinalis bv. officinalis str. HAMBI 1141]|jgi:hypothetical protein|uniref:Uncharacterized protein n=1 Tax=Neorhizobium galegae bv. officinalis bv. officinalis str. HAMBI 1141 TaxID=1028801 RepID=A0A068TII9_NEOGA|nr:Hypothetical protein RG1141_PA10520 [Neorhizobium galegae bv. officinalis bv. officinalis str. HAMBI 1141]